MNAARKREEESAGLVLDTSSVCARPGSRFSDKDASVIAPRLFAIVKSGELTPDAVVEDAKDPDSPLHRFFEWDDSKAAHQHRLATARMITRSVSFRVMTLGGELHAHQAAFISMSAGPTNEDEADAPASRRYIPISEVLADRDMTAEAIKRAKAEMQAWITRYSMLIRLAGARKAAESVLQELEKAA